MPAKHNEATAWSSPSLTSCFQIDPGTQGKPAEKQIWQQVSEGSLINVQGVAGLSKLTHRNHLKSQAGVEERMIRWIYIPEEQNWCKVSE